MGEGKIVKTEAGGCAKKKGWGAQKPRRGFKRR